MESKQQFDIKSFDELSLAELYKILKLRQEVFIVEQNCPYLDADDLDQIAYHLLIIKDDKLAAYSRVFSPNSSSDGHAAIGRIITGQSYRNQGLGIDIVNKSIAFCKDKFKGSPIKISAQVYLLKFYNKFGFKEVGEQYLEDDIPHVKMILTF